MLVSVADAEVAISFEFLCEELSTELLFDKIAGFAFASSFDS